MELNIFKKQLINKALEKGFTDCEVYYSLSSNFSIEVYKSNLDKYTDATSSGVAFRGIYKGNMGYAYSEVLKEDIIDFLIDTAIFNATVIENCEEEIIFEGEENYDFIEPCVSETLSLEEKIKVAFDIEEAIKKYSDKVENPIINLGNFKSITSITNSKGLDLTEEKAYSLTYVTVTVKEGEERKNAYEIWGGKSFTEIDINKFVSKGVEKSLSKLGEKSVKSGKYNLLLTNEVTYDFLEIFFSMFVGEQVQKGFSILKDKLGEKIVSDLITLKDFSKVEGSLAISAFDSEGVATRDTILVENGVLKNYLYNLKTAKVDGVKSSGNGFRNSYKGGVTTLPKNFYIEKGNLTYDEMVKKLDNGIIIETLQGQHAGANSITGEFSLQAYGKLVVDGKIVQPIDGIVISDSYLNMLSKVLAVGSDLKFDLPMGACCFGAPSIIVSDVSVAGE
ncbi:MAG: TldD/PmbA family protein [Lachnospirales bacterium]